MGEEWLFFLFFVRKTVNSLIYRIIVYILKKEVKRMELVVTAKIRLLPTETQHLQLVETMQAMKQALNFASKVAYEQQYEIR
ncbi:Pedicted protein [Anoxybacillus flavithermus WK1]|uniref:Pedicted protein n=1 Tax=Anoxybacillus flavithermus (strain DSM 21510 / WK1) TaxID=491915 RepID=B7GL13_ANOFW|nr:Pedicted protein [Anoxybacillus flavithermus WK1]